MYPKSHRAEYGAAILQLFRDQCRDAWAEQRARGLIGFWLRTLTDLLKTSVLEHLSNLNRSRIMPTLFRPTIKPLPAFIGICALVALPIFFVSVVITFILPETYRATATVAISRSAAEVSMAATNSAYGNNWFMGEFDTLQSKPVLERTVKNLDLQDIWGKKYNNGQPLNVADALAMLKSRLDILPVKARDGAAANVAAGFLVRVRAYSDSAEEAAKIANGVVEGYRDFREEQEREVVAVPTQRRVTLMDTAVPELRAVRPNKPLNIVVGALMGLLIGVIIAPLVLGLFAWLRNRRKVASLPQKA